MLNNVTAEQLGISLNRAGPDFPSPLAARTTDRNPMLDPFAERGLACLNERAGTYFGN